MGEALENSSSTTATRCKLVELLFSAKAFPTKKDAGVNVVNHILIIFVLEHTDIKSPIMSIGKKKRKFVLYRVTVVLVKKKMFKLNRAAC